MNEVTNAAMLDFWNGDAGQKWVHFQDMMDVSLAPLGREAMAAARITEGDRVIDVGCGCGDTALELARRVGPAGRVLGVDISEPMLARARARAADSGESHVAFELGDAQVQRFQKGQFDAVFSRFGVMFFEDPAAAFANLAGALEPGGRLGFVCWRPPQESSWVHVPLGVVAKHVPIPPPSGPDEPGPFAFADRERVERILAGAGFADVEIRAHDAPFNVAGGRGLDDVAAFFVQMGPTSRAINEAGADDATKARIAADLKETLAPYDAGQGVVMGAATWIVTARRAS